MRHTTNKANDAISSRLVEIIGEEPLTSFARRCGVMEGTLRNIIKSGAWPRTDNLIAIADAANVTIEWLATGRGPKMRAAICSSPSANTKAASTINVDDLERLELAVESVEEGLGPKHRTLPPSKYAQLIVAVYDLLADMEKKENVIKFIKLAA